MRKTKQIIIEIVSVLSLLFAFSSYGLCAEKPTFEILAEAYEVNVDETVEVTIEPTENMSLGGMSFVVSYDANRFSYLEDSASVGVTAFSENATVNTSRIGYVIFECSASELTNVEVPAHTGVLSFTLCATQKTEATSLSFVRNLDESADKDPVCAVFNNGQVEEADVLWQDSDTIKISGLKVETVEINASDVVTMKSGETMTFTATTLPSQAENIAVLYSVTAISGNAVVGSESGVLEAVSPGIVTLRASAADGGGAYDEISIVILASGKATNVYFGGINVSSGGYFKNNGQKGSSKSYNIYYNPKTACLSLKSAKVTSLYSAGEQSNFGLYANGDITIKLSGTNYIASYADQLTCGVFCGGDLIISGSGKGKLVIGSKETQISQGITSAGAIKLSGCALVEVRADSVVKNAIQSKGESLVSSSTVTLAKSETAFSSFLSLNIKSSTLNIAASQIGLVSTLGDISASSSKIYIQDVQSAGLKANGEGKSIKLSSTDLSIKGNDCENGMLTDHTFNEDGATKLTLSGCKNGISSEFILLGHSFPGYAAFYSCVEDINGSLLYTKSIEKTETDDSVIYYPECWASPAQGSYKNISLGWAEDNGVDGYVIEAYISKAWRRLKTVYSDNRDYFFETTSGSFAANTTYKLRIRSFIGDGSEREYFSLYSLSVKTGVKAPSLNASNSSGITKLSWGKVSGANLYQIFVSEDNVNWSLIYSGSDLSFSHNAQAGKKYYYKPCASRIYTLGLFSDSPEAFGTTKSFVSLSGVPASPVAVSAGGKVNISAVVEHDMLITSPERGIEVYRATSKKGSFKRVARVESVQNESFVYTDSSVNISKTYYYKLRSYIIISGKTYYSPYTKVFGVKVK